MTELTTTPENKMCLNSEEEEKKEKESVDEPRTLFDRLGREPAIHAAVEEFYVRVISDGELAPFFDNVDMDRLKIHQEKFFTLAFTKIPKSVDVPALILNKHLHLFDMGLNEKHFDLVAGHFVDTLTTIGVPEPLIGECVDVVIPLRAVFEQGAAASKAKSQQDNAED